MNRKGINYDVGIEATGGFMSRPDFDAETAGRELAVIRNGLHCNAVRISGTDPERLMTAAEIALEQGLEVWLSPHLHDESAEATLEYTVACAEQAERLRRRYPGLIFILGCELTLFMQGLLEGRTIFERISGPSFMESIRTGEHNKVLHAFLEKANRAVRDVFPGQVAYSSAPLESVDWSMFDFVCLDHYRDRRNKVVYAERLESYFVWDKPVVITEFGCCTYEGAQDAGGRGWMIIDREKRSPRRLKGEYTRNEALQATELAEQIALFQTAGVDGAFVYTFVAPAMVHEEEPLLDLDMASYSLVKSYAGKWGTAYPDMAWEPKEAFAAVARLYAQL